VLVRALDKEDHKLPALAALITVAQRHPEEARSLAPQIKDNLIKPFVQALLSKDESDVNAFKNKLALASGEQKVLAIQLAAVLAHPALEETLDKLRVSTDGNEVEKPTWRYLATKASFSLLMRKTAS